ncbi:efflux RND transporter periplasmic adaptor subunit [Leptolyngbya sp. FACHB-36]|uniref:efflux RND transporter periplasmic adaptor subunit n=1 Tax=Leptolyngbya sp. FACHB-36 TaxID=2692808 RepID=UPI00168062D9|nr:efflux RND transporter periplasmic adaptor subunit [Leptolyngbya sp. FACHB-36]MBD2021792.1 efflux RND transporter periplasmic adaptor subunit [Leptolyngbya sp. FACHB-36]
MRRIIQLRGSLTAIALSAILAGSLGLLAGCNGTSKAEAESRPRGEGQNSGPAAVDAATAQVGAIEQAREYTGTTQPFREVSLRSQAEGQLLNLSVDVGDAVTQGQTLGQLDSGVLSAAVTEAQAEVAARESEVASAQTEVSDARTEVERARITLQQAQSDLRRQQQLLRDGAIAERDVEASQTQVGTAQQALRSARERVGTRQQAVTAAQRRVAAQQAVVAQQQERQSFTVVRSPVTGAVLQRVTEPGNLVQPGSELLRVGDFSQIKITAQVSELELGNLRVGQPVQVRLDAFPNQTFSGRVSRVSPAADPTARLVPIEVTMPNNGRIGSGLLARVSFNQRPTARRVVVPEMALRANEDPKARQKQDNQNQGNQNQQSNRSQRDMGTIFVVEESGDGAKVRARQVTLGDRGDGEVEVISGLKAGDQFVARSNRALKDGDSVRLSVLSKQPNQQRSGG